MTDHQKDTIKSDSLLVLPGKWAFLCSKNLQLDGSLNIMLAMHGAMVSMSMKELAIVQHI
jgi:hypothetical protein